MPEWYDGLPPEATYEVDNNGVKTTIPYKDAPFVKESPTLDHYVKKTHEWHKELGSRIPVRVDKTKPEEVAKWRSEHLPKLYNAGVLEAPPKAVEEYDIKKPEKLPEGIIWRDDVAKELGEVALKHGIPKAAIADLLDLHSKALAGNAEIFKTSYDQAMIELKKEFGTEFDSTLEASKRLTAAVFKNPTDLELIESTGIGNHPSFVGIMMRLARLASSDSSIIPEAQKGAGGGMTWEQVRAEVADIMGNPQNKWHMLYQRGDPSAIAHVDSLYAQIPGAKDQVDLSRVGVNQ